MLYSSKHFSIAIDRSAREVYEFAANPMNLPKWAAGLAQASIEKSGDHWIAESPMGRVEIRFAQRNEFGVLDHDVTLPTGDVVHNPLRVMRNGTGSEVIFTLRHLPGMSQADFDRDAKMIVQDLAALKTLLELSREVR